METELCKSSFLELFQPNESQSFHVLDQQIFHPQHNGLQHFAEGLIDIFSPLSAHDEPRTKVRSVVSSPETMGNAA